MPQLKVVADNSGMPVYEAMCKSILECRRVDEVAKLQDDVKRQLYGQQVKDSNTMKAALNEIYIRAERQLGELLSKLPRQDRPSRYDTGRGAATAPGSESKRKIMDENNITPRRASRAESIASIPKKEFEREVVKPKASIRKMVDYAKTREPPRPKPKLRDESLEIQMRLIEALERIARGLEQAVTGMRLKDLNLEKMIDQDIKMPGLVMNELRKIQKHMAVLSAICPCPLKKAAQQNMPLLINSN